MYFVQNRLVKIYTIVQYSNKSACNEHSKNAIICTRYLVWQFKTVENVLGVLMLEVNIGKRKNSIKKE